MDNKKDIRSIFCMFMTSGDIKFQCSDGRIHIQSKDCQNKLSITFYFNENIDKNEALKFINDREIPQGFFDF